LRIGFLYSIMTIVPYYLELVVRIGWSLAMLRVVIWTVALVAAYDHVICNGILASAAMQVASSMMHYF